MYKFLFQNLHKHSYSKLTNSYSGGCIHLQPSSCDGGTAVKQEDLKEVFAIPCVDPRYLNSQQPEYSALVLFKNYRPLEAFERLEY